jgi:hypothetical protein
MKKSINTILAIVSAFTLFGCSSKEVSPYTNLDSIQLPSKNYPKSTNKNTELSFATINPVLKINLNISQDLYDSLSKRLKDDVNKLSCQIPLEIKKILISKGISVSDNYWSRNDMTFSQKRDTSILFYPIIKIDMDQNTFDVVELNGRVENKIETTGKIQINARVELIALEPLSGEKIWIKSLPLRREKLEKDISYKGTLKRSINIFTIDTKAKNIAEDIDNLIIEIYTKILEGVDKFVDYNEFILLNKDIDKIKKIKRY